MKCASNAELNYYNSLLAEDRSDEALDYLKKLHNKYPNDRVVLIQLGSLLLKRKTDISQAFYYFSLAQNESNIDHINTEIATYYLESGNFKKAEEYFLKLRDFKARTIGFKHFGLLKVYMHTEEYDKALEHIKALKPYRESGLFRVEHFYNAKMFVLKMLGKLDLSMITSTNNYFINQLVDYNKEYAIEHIEEHLSEKPKEDDNLEKLVKAIFPCLNEGERIHSSFKEETNISDLYDYCYENIQDRNPDGYGLVDFYRIKLNNPIGLTYSGYQTEYIEVVTFVNSKEIISIYPINITHVNKDAKRLKTEDEIVKKKTKKNTNKR